MPETVPGPAAPTPTTPEVATLLARLHRHAPPVPDGGPPRALLGAEARERDLVAWQALGSAGRLILRLAVVDALPAIPVPADPTARARYTVTRGRYAAGGPPLRCVRRLTAPDTRRAAAGALCILGVLGDRFHAGAIARWMAYLDPLDHDPPLDVALSIYFARVGRLGLELVTNVAADSAHLDEGRAVAIATLSGMVHHHPAWRQSVIRTLCEILHVAAAHHPLEATVAGVAVAALCRLEATTALPAIRAAYTRGIVDTGVISWNDVRRALDPQPHRPRPRRR